MTPTSLLINRSSFGYCYIALPLMLVAISCQKQRELPPVPIVDLASAQAGVRQAIEPAYAAARARPKDAVTINRLGMLLHAHNLLGTAALVYERAAALDPGQPDSSYYLGTVLAATGNYADAIAPLRSSLKLREAVAVRLRLAETLFEAGKPADARHEYETLVAADSSLAAAYFGLGRCLSGAEAVSMLERAIRLFPRYGAAQFTLATVYRQLGERSKAEAALDNYERDKLQVPPISDPAMAAIRALDASATGLLRASYAMELQGQLPQSAALQEQAVAADPTLTQAWVNLIALYARLDQGPKAEMAYRKALTLEPNNAEAHYNFGTFCAQANRFNDARKAFESAVAGDPGNAKALDSLGAIVEQDGAWDRAATLYRRAVAADPKLCLAHYHLGRSYANQRRYPEAIQQFERSIEPATAQTPAFLYALGATHARAGAHTKALEVLQLAHKLAEQWQQGELAASIERDLSTLRGRQH